MQRMRTPEEMARPQWELDKMDRDNFDPAVQKISAYLTQENSVLHERVRKLEIALAAEREACAKVAEEYGIARDNHEKKPNTLKETALGTAKHIATLIRGRQEVPGISVTTAFTIAKEG